MIVCHPDWIAQFSTHQSTNLQWVVGGATRQQSVWAGLSSLMQDPPDTVLIHDGARPLTTPAIFENCYKTAEIQGSAITAVNSTDTLAHAANGEILDFLDRTRVVRIQTPQAFHFDRIWRAHLQARETGQTDVSDDSQLYAQMGWKTVLIEGDIQNIKITHALDLKLAEAILDGFI